MSAACFCMRVLAGCKSRTEAEYLSALLIHMCSLEMLVLDCGTRSRSERGSGRAREALFLNPFGVRWITRAEKQRLVFLHRLS